MFGNALEAWLEPGQSGKFVSKRFHILTHKQLHQVCGCTCHKIHCQIGCRFLVRNVAQILQSLIPIQPCNPLTVLFNFNDSQCQVSPILKSSFDHNKIWLISQNPACLPGLDSIVHGVNGDSSTGFGFRMRGRHTSHRVEFGLWLDHELLAQWENMCQEAVDWAIQWCLIA